MPCIVHYPPYGQPARPEAAPEILADLADASLADSDYSRDELFGHDWEELGPGETIDD